MKRCVNLKNRFGKTFRIQYEETALLPGESKRDSWFMQIPCKMGIIYPHGGLNLCAELHGHAGLAKKLAGMGYKVLHNSSEGMTLLFPVADFKQVARVMKPIRLKTRKLTPAQKIALVARLQAGRKSKSGSET